MEKLGEFLRRIGMLQHRDQVASELQKEMQLHLDLRRQQQVESGVAPNDAAAAAHRRFGNPTLLRERSYTEWGWSWLEGLLQDMLYGLRHPALARRHHRGAAVVRTRHRREYRYLQPDGCRHVALAASEEPAGVGGARHSERQRI